MYPYRICGVIAISAFAGIASAANPVLVDSAGSGQFTTIQAAINSWCAGGSNAGETAPFVIKIKAGSGPYDEPLTLDEAVIGQGNISGDLVIESDTSGTVVVVKLQSNSASTLGANDGLMISQQVHDVTFRDLVFTRSLTNYPVDDMVRQDESAANNTMNLISFYNCIFAEMDESGNPMTTTKAGALAPRPAIGGTGRTANAFLLQHWGDAGESIQMILDNCTFYGGSSTNCYARTEGAGPEFVQVNNCLSTYAGFNCFQFGGANPTATTTVTGTDVTAGPLNCTAAINPLGGGHGIQVGNTTAGHVANISNFLAYAQGTASTPAGTNASRGISGGHGALILSDVILNVPNYGVVDITHDNATWNRVTINNPTAAYLGVEASAGVAPAGSLTVTDSIISGAGTKFNGLNATGLPTGGVTVNNSALPTEGPNAIGATGTITANNVITADPMYASLDGTLASFMDVQNSAYATAATGGTPLSGGADFIGSSNVKDWSVY